MKKINVEAMLSVLSDTQTIIDKDKLSELIGKVSERELNEVELDNVAAAAMPDWIRFREQSERLNKNND